MKSVMRELKRQLHELHDAGGVIDPLCIAGDMIDAYLADGTFTRCGKCSRVFETDRLQDGTCELCIKSIKHKTLGELREWANEEDVVSDSE